MALDRTGTRNVSTRQYARLERWALRKPVIALMGEFSSGKSTLMNFLIDDDLLPTKITATELPPIWFSYGTHASFWVDDDWNKIPVELTAINTIPKTARFARIYVEAEFLRSCDLIDTPGISDPNLARESWRFAAGVANMIIWCTTANQAWRESERSTWLSFSSRLRRNSILVVTRSDKLLTQLDREKVARRLQREAGDFFVETVFLSTLDAMQAKHQLVEGTPTALWSQSGASGLLDELNTQIGAIGNRRLKMLDRYDTGTGEARPQIRSEARQRLESNLSAPVSVIPARPQSAGTARRTPREALSQVAGQTSLMADEAAEYLQVQGADAASPRAARRRLAAEAVRRGVTPEPLMTTEAASSPLRSETATTDDMYAFAGAPAAVAVGEPEPAADGPVAAPTIRTSAVDIPYEVQAWRDIVARNPVDPVLRPMLAMIDELLHRLTGAEPAEAADAERGSGPNQGEEARRIV